jgi:Carbohydrate family 9 binding domain-like
MYAVLPCRTGVPAARSVVALLAVLASMAAGPLPAQRPDGTPVTAGHAVRATRAPEIDGLENDAVWRQATPMTAFRQFEPGENLEPTFRTEARAAYDDRYLYVLVRAFDPHPDSLAALLSRRDVKTPSDQLKIIIDAYHDGRTGVELAVNPV